MQVLYLLQHWRLTQLQGSLGHCFKLYLAGGCANYMYIVPFSLLLLHVVDIIAFVTYV